MALLSSVALTSMAFVSSTIAETSASSCVEGPPVVDIILSQIVTGQSTLKCDARWLLGMARAACIKQEAVEDVLMFTGVEPHKNVRVIFGLNGS